MPEILIVDDHDKIRNFIAELLQKEGYEIASVNSGEKCIEYLAKDTPDLIFLDLVMQGIGGLETLRRVKSLHKDLPVVMLTSSEKVEDIVLSMKYGADDYLTKDKITERLIITAKNFLKAQNLAKEVIKLKDERKNIFLGDPLIGESKAMKEVFELIDSASKSDIKVLVYGETGTGKELVARTIHTKSKRAENPFVAIDCSMLPETLAESELFGYEKGAFTGAAERKIGRFELANQGTLFLDEIGNLSSNIQMKLLRFLEDRNISRLGSKKNVEVDVRIISASNVNLENSVAKDKFRGDLYYRLNVFLIALPPLKDRSDDLILLADYFTKKFADEQHKNNIEISKEAISCLKKYHWPGNIRELRNVIERAVLLTNSVISPEHLAISNTQTNIGGLTEINFDENVSLHEISKKASGIAEKRLIMKVLKETDNNKTEASKILQIDYKTLYNKMKEYNIQF